MFARLLTAVALTLGPVAAPPGAAETDPLDSFLEELDGFSARFHQVVIDADGRTLDDVRGELVWARPDRFRWDYLDPYEQLIVSDGERIWIYDPDLEQVTVRSAGPEMNSPLALLEGRSRLEENFEVTMEAGEGGRRWVRLVPLQPDGDFRLIRMAIADGSLEQIEIHDAFGQVSTIELSQAERNPTVTPELFEFTPPEGVDVIDSTQ